MSLPRGALALHAVETAQAIGAAREATQRAVAGAREQAAVVFAAAAARRRQEPETAALLAASGDSLMALADAVDEVAKAQAMMIGLCVLIAEERG